MFNSEKLFKDVSDVLSESEKGLLKSLCDELDKYNILRNNPQMDLYIDFCTEDSGNEWNPYHTFSLRLVNHQEENVCSEMSLRELDNVVCALSYYEELSDGFTKKRNQAIKEDNDKILSIIEQRKKDNRIVFFALDEVVSQPLDTFVSQPLEGQLYDLNRGEEVILALRDTDWNRGTQRWINDLALTSLVRYYYNRCKELEWKCSQKDDKILTESIINNK